jgi:hypothetical protein
MVCLDAMSMACLGEMKIGSLAAMPLTLTNEQIPQMLVMMPLKELATPNAILEAAWKWKEVVVLPK